MSQIDKSLINNLRKAITENLAGEITQQFKEAGNTSAAVKLTLGRSDIYDTKFTSLINQYQKHTNHPKPTSLADFLSFSHWLVDVHRAKVSYRSWVLYRSAVLSIIADKDVQAIVKVPPLNKRSDVEKSTNSKRLKKLPDNVYADIVGYLRRSNSKYSDVTERLLFIVRKLGIRPAEILECEVVTHKGFRFLKIRSLKKENRIFQDEEVTNKYPYRYSPMIHLNDDEVAYINATIRSFSALASKEIFDSLYEGIRFCFLRAVKNLNLSTRETSYSLYSARQQFSADLKATPIQKRLASMIMSHNEEDTIRHHYARKVNGRPLFSADAKYEALIMECFEGQI
jgi:hypothetical protein